MAFKGTFVEHVFRLLQFNYFYKIKASKWERAGVPDLVCSHMKD